MTEDNRTAAVNVEVELESGLHRYCLPKRGSSEEVAEAIGASWRLLQTAPTGVTAPLLAAVYAAPLSEILPPDFALWLYGGTGSFKSTLAALFLSHYGDFSETNLPLSFESTANALERSLFLAKDVLTVVDDWRPGVTRADSDDMDRKAQRLLRGVGNRQGRGRMTSETMLRDSYPPRGMVVATAEALPEGPAFQSAAARSLSVNVSRDVIDLPRLSELQLHREALGIAMAGYVGYLAERYDDLNKTLPKRKAEMREIIRGGLPGAHPRAADNAAVLIAALEQFARFSASAGAMDKKKATGLYEEASDGVLEAARVHVESTSGGDPASTFVTVLRSLLEGGKAYLRNREDRKRPPRGCLELGWETYGGDEGPSRPVYDPAPRADLVGWADDEYLYLDKEAAYAAVAGFANRGGVPFGVKPRALWEAMSRNGISLTDEGRNDTTARIDGMSKRVIQIPRRALLEQGG